MMWRATGGTTKSPEGGGKTVEPIRTDFRGYEGKFVAVDARTGAIVMADDDYHSLCDRMDEAKLGPSAAITRVPLPDEPRYRIG
jgi:hypothetical protein